LVSQDRIVGISSILEIKLKNSNTTLADRYISFNKADYKKGINSLVVDLVGEELPTSFFATTTREELSILHRALLVSVQPVLRRAP